MENTSTMSNLGILLAHLGNVSQAQDLLTRCHALRKSVLGENHNLTISAAKNLERVMGARRDDVFVDTSFERKCDSEATRSPLREFMNL